MALSATQKSLPLNNSSSPSNSSRQNSELSIVVEPIDEAKSRTAEIERMQRKMVPLSLVFSDSSSRIPPRPPSTSLCTRIWGAINQGINKACFFHPSQNFKTKFIQTTYNGAQAFTMFGILQGISSILLSLAHSESKPVAITCTVISATVSVAHFAYIQGMFTDSVTYFKVFRHMFEAVFVSIGDLHRKKVEIAERVNTLMSLSSLRKTEADAQFALLQKQIAVLQKEVATLRKQQDNAPAEARISIGSDSQQPQKAQQATRDQEDLPKLAIESYMQFFKTVLDETSGRRNFSSLDEKNAFAQKLSQLMQAPSPR